MNAKDLTSLRTEAKQRMDQAVEHGKKELSGVRTGRAAASMLDPVQVEAYGALMPLNQVAGLSIPEPSLIVAQPRCSLGGCRAGWRADREYLIGWRGSTGCANDRRGNLVQQRVVGIDDYQVDIAPHASSHALMVENVDRPGMIGRVGMLLSQADVNISAMSLARSAPREDALMLLAVDDEIPDSVVAAVRALDGIVDAWAIHLG